MSDDTDFRKHPFSPGPWEVDDTFRIYTTEGLTIADTRDAFEVWRDVEKESPDQQEALFSEIEGNGKLIAAAPELYEGVIAAISALRSYQYGNGSPDLAKEIADSLTTLLAEIGVGMPALLASPVRPACTGQAKPEGLAESLKRQTAEWE